MLHVFIFTSVFSREELTKQQAAARYRKLHMEGKTEEAQADLARLALIRKQREEAAKRREEEMKGNYFKRMRDGIKNTQDALIVLENCRHAYLN